MIHLSEDVHLIFEHFWVFDEAFIDNLDTTFGVRWLFERGLINGAVSSTSDGLDESKITL